MAIFALGTVPGTVSNSGRLKHFERFSLVTLAQPSVNVLETGPVLYHPLELVGAKKKKKKGWLALHYTVIERDNRRASKQASNEKRLFGQFT